MTTNDDDRETNDEMRTSYDDIRKTMNDDGGDGALKNCGGDGALTSHSSNCGNGRLIYCVGSSLINTPFTKYL